MTTLPPLNIRYPFDPTGKSPDNLVVREVRTLPPVHHRILVPNLGAFYSDSLRVYHNERELEKGKDYEIAGHYHDASEATGKSVDVNIVFTNLDIVGDVELTYQVVGGQFTGVWESIQHYVNVLLVDPRKVRWDDILDKPELFAPKDHFHDINDVYGLNQLIPWLQAIEMAIQRLKTKEFRKLYDRFLKLKRDVEDLHAQVINTVNRLGDQVNLIISDNRLLNQKVNDLKQKTLELANADDELLKLIKTLQEKDKVHERELTRLEDDKQDKAEMVHYVRIHLNNTKQRVDHFYELGVTGPNIPRHITYPNDKASQELQYRQATTHFMTGPIPEELFVGQRNPYDPDKRAAFLPQNKNDVLKRRMTHYHGFSVANPEAPEGSSPFKLIDFGYGHTYLHHDKVFGPAVRDADGYLLRDQKTGDGVGAGYVPERIVTDRNLKDIREIQSIITPPKRIIELYIDGNGDNDNPGTREKPMRHIGVALARYDTADAHLVVYLKQGQTHSWLPGHYQDADNGIIKVKTPRLVFTPYRIDRHEQADQEPKDKAMTGSNVNGFAASYKNRINNRRLDQPRLWWKGENNTKTSIRIVNSENDFLPIIVNSDTITHDNVMVSPYDFSRNLNLVFANLEVQVTNYHDPRYQNNRAGLVGWGSVKVDLLQCNLNLSENASLVMTLENINSVEADYHHGVTINFKPASPTNNPVIGNGKLLWGNGEGVTFNWLADKRWLTQANLNKYFPHLSVGLPGWDSHFMGNIRPIDMKIPSKYLPLSKKRYNQISLQEDGYYFGSEPPPDLRALYVDAVNGDDNNRGSRAEPLRTLRRALTRVESTMDRSIYLYQGQEHVLDNREGLINLMGGEINICPYGPDVDRIQPLQHVGRRREATTETWETNTRVKFVFTKENPNSAAKVNWIGKSLFYVPYSTKLNFTGVRIVNTPNEKLVELDANPNLKDANGNQYRKEWVLGINNPSSAGKLTISLWYSSFHFEGNYTKPELNPFLFGQTAAGGGLSFVTSMLQGEKMTGLGHIFHHPSGPNIYLTIDSSLPDDKVRQYFGNINRRSTGLSTVSVDGGSKWLEHTLPISNDLQIRQTAVFLWNSDTKGHYWGAEGVQVGRFSFNGEQFKLDKPIRNDRNQVLGVSAQPGNRIRQNEDGVYLGPESPPDLSDLFISSRWGNDNNNGTEAKPLRTIEEAFKRLARNAQGVTSRIHLRAGEHFEWANAYIPDNKIYLDVYNVPENMKIPDNRTPYWYPWVARDYPRPTVNVRARTFPAGHLFEHLYRRDTLEVHTLEARGVIFNLYEANQEEPTKNGSFAGWVTGEMCKLHGCILNKIGDAYANGSGMATYRADSWFRTMRNQFINCQLNGFYTQPSQVTNKNFSRLFYPDNGVVSVQLIDWVDGNNTVSNHNGIRAVLPALPRARRDDMRRMITLTNAAYPYAVFVNRESKVITGINFNWDIFAYSPL